MIPDQTLAEIEAAARAATEPGDWSADENIIWSNGRGVPVADVRIGTPVWYKGPALPYEANAHFITLACNNAAAMVKEIRALRAALYVNEHGVERILRFLAEAGYKVDPIVMSSAVGLYVETLARATQKGTSDV